MTTKEKSEILAVARKVRADFSYMETNEFKDFVQRLRWLLRALDYPAFWRRIGL